MPVLHGFNGKQAKRWKESIIICWLDRCSSPLFGVEAFDFWGRGERGGKGLFFSLTRALGGGGTFVEMGFRDVKGSETMGGGGRLVFLLFPK